MNAAPHSSSEADTPAVAGTQAFGKFMRVLQLVADAEQPPNVAALMRATGFPRPTVHRIVAALVAERMLLEDPATHGLALGPRLIQLAGRAWGRSDLRLGAADALRRLRDATGETVHLAVPSGRAMVFIDKLESPAAVRMSSRIGSSVPLHVTAVGKAWLAALPPAERAAQLDGLPLPRHTDHTLTDPAALRAELDLTAARGWSTDREEHETGVYCFGAPVLGADGRPVAAISVTTLVFRQRADVAQAYVAPLLAACAAVSERLAQQPRPDPCGTA
ncbi:IclR family transcriptional regulator [Pseudorhodoferax sp.]|uniref:IclR family transcriptional regulator n=1 Tax=Pseudorhodoferax sp. TaxID=1993553 RepID=UPI0039E50E28